MPDPVPAFTAEHCRKLADLILYGSIGWHPRAHDGEPEAIRAALAELDRLQANRDELLVVLKEAMTRTDHEFRCPCRVDSPDPRHWYGCICWRKQAETAIARAEGRTDG